MKFDTVVIGGGLAGLTAAIKIAGQSRKVAVVSTGRSTLHFNSGHMGLLGFDSAHRPVSDLHSAIAALPAGHPYQMIGADNISRLQTESRQLLSECGIDMAGNDGTNHNRITPLGIVRPAWLTLEGMMTLDTMHFLPGKRISIVGITGFLDFYPRFLAAGLARHGFTTSIHSIDTPITRHLRSSESEMRAANIARSLTDDSIARMVAAIESSVSSFSPDAVIFPAVAGLADPADFTRLRQLCGYPLFYGTTLGTSVPGMMIHELMLQRFRALGGTIFNGDSAVSAQYSGDRLISVGTRRLGDDRLEAGHFIFAGGRFFSHGLRMLPDRITEPALVLDITGPDNRRYDKNIFAPQPFMKAGVATDRNFHALRSGSPVCNLTVIGSALAGADSLQEDSGAGIAMLTAVHAAGQILKN